MGANKRRSKPRLGDDGGASSVRNDRLGVNLVSLLVTCAVLFIGVKIADGSFTSDMNRISRNLDSALYNVLEDLQRPNFTDFVNVNATFSASTDFNPRGMVGLYNMTSLFMDAIVENNIDPDGILVINNGNVQLGSIEDQWQSLLKRFSGLLAVVIILLVLAIFFPLCGLCFCCCRCCGRCGARSEPFDKKHDCCRKFILGTLLICMGTLLLFGVVCAFVSNQHMQDSTDDLVPSIRVSVNDAQTYLNMIGQQLKILLVTNYGEFQGVLFDVLDRSSQIVYEQLALYSNAVAITQVSSIVNGLDDVKTNLTEMKNITNALRVSASQLNDALRKVKRDLLDTLNTCKMISACQELSDKYINKLNTNIDFNNIPDVSSEMNQLQEILSDDIVNTVQKGQDALQQIETTINETVQSSLESVRDAVTKAGDQISASVSNVTNVLTDVSKFIRDNTDQPLTDAQYYIKEYSPIRYYVGIGISCLLLLVTLCLTLGLICGICGKRPDSYSDDCCNKGAGSKFLMIAVGIMFLSGIVIAVVTIVYFALGLVSQRLVCDSFRNYNSSKVLEFVSDAVDLKEVTGIDLTITHVLSTCHQNKSAYAVFNLESKFNLTSISQYLEEYDIQSALDELRKQINVPVDIVILSEEAKAQLTELAGSGISDIEFSRFTSVLDDNLTTVDLNDLLKQLDVVINAVSQHSEMNEIQTKLQLSRLHLETYQARLIVPIINNAEKLIDIAGNMEHSLKFGKDSFKDAIIQLIEEVSAAEAYLRYNGTELLSNIAESFTMGVKNQVEGYLNRVVDNVRDNVGRCGPLSTVIQATLTATCDKILLPMNGFWFVLFWSLLVFIITIILSVKLAMLYQKYDSYPGSVVEAEYLYDAYADRENIPLASGKAAKKKNKKPKRYDGRGGAYPPEAGDHVGPRDYAGGSNHQDARYADMAPKHWEDFPNGGPPQYQRAPTEYERPPPYYYPGNGEQH